MVQARENPGEIVPGLNFTASLIAGQRIVKLDNTNVDGVALAAAATDALYGVTLNDIPALPDGIGGDIVVTGMARVEAGATIAIGDKLTSDASGLAVPTTTDNDGIIGTAKTAGLITVDIEVDLIGPGVQRGL